MSWYDQTADLEVIHHGNYMGPTDDQGRTIATCGARSYISPIDGIRLDLRIEHVTCEACIRVIARKVDRAIAFGFKP